MRRRFAPYIGHAIFAWAILAGPGLVQADDSSLATYQVTIPLSNNGLPASDLVDTSGAHPRILNPQEAWNLKKKSNLDLSTLDPDSTSDIWKNESTEQDDAQDDSLPIRSGDTVTFQGFVATPIGLGRLKFNVQVQSGNEPPRTLTLLLSRNVHTNLIRKGLLRRLGYKIPPMKYLSKINVVLPDAETHDKLFPAAIANYAMGAAKRWQAASPSGASPLTFSLQDVVAMEATPLYYNLALGPPREQIGDTQQVRPLAPRTLRALGAIYGLTDIPENIHQSSWSAGRVEDGQIVIDVSDRGNYACTIDDALWASKRIAKLTRADVEDIVSKAQFPDFVAKLVVENLISRRNSLLSLFKVPASPIAFDPNISFGTQLVDGKFVTQDWQALGYAGNFSGKELDSPLKEIWWYVRSLVQSNVTANLLQKFNDKLPQLSVNDAINQHNEKLYNDALEQYMKDGTTQAVHFGKWTAPIASGGVDISRDIVIGSYMGTTGDDGSSNIVQLADNFGFHASAGLYVGFDGLPVDPLPVNMQGQIMGSASIAVTHLKPVKSLKAAVQEPMKNEFVPWIFYKASSVLEEVSAIQNGAPQSPDDLKKKLADELETLKQFIGEDESLILTESLSLNENLQIGVQGGGDIAPSIGVQPGANQVLLWRLHIRRPKSNPNTLMIYKDNGSLNGVQVSLNLSVGAPATLPVVQVTAKSVSGTADTEYYRVNINPDPEKNPQLYANSAALSVALKGRSLEALQELQKPTLVSTRFKDISDSFQFLYFVNRGLKSNGQVTVTLPNGASDSFISLSDGKQQGGSYQSLATQIANFLVQKFTNNPNLNIDTKASQNPGQTYKGYSSTRNGTLQARSADDKLSELFGKVQYRWEGWDISASDAQALVDSLSDKYGFTLYPSGFMHDTREVQLYSITLSVNFYESALKNFLSISPQVESALVKKYTDYHHCYSHPTDENPTLPSPNRKECQAIGKFDSAYKDYHQEARGWFANLVAKFKIHSTNDPLSEANAVLGIMTNLEQFLTFQDMIALSGGTDATGNPKNMYVQSMLSGFRVGSENLSQPIPSNTFGHVNPDQTGGPLDSAQQILGIDSGELEGQWLRDHL